MIRQCKNCGADFTPDRRNVAKGQGWCCSKRCATQLRHRTGGFPEKSPWTDEQRREYIAKRKANGTWHEGESHPKWKGGVGDDGAYRAVRRNGRKIRQHRVIAEQALQRPLTPHEVVHHIDGDGRNNALRNLQVMPKAVHTALHQTAWWRWGIHKPIIAIGYPILGTL